MSEFLIGEAVTVPASPPYSTVRMPGVVSKVCRNSETHRIICVFIHCPHCALKSDATPWTYPYDPDRLERTGIARQRR